MRFERLAVPAYGPFTRFLLELPAAGADFHLIYGPNEAGKSSLLRAIRDLLYGIHGQTPDNFLHDYKALRIGGTIASARGRRLSFQRRKGNRNTLLDGDDNPLPDEALAGFLGVVDRDFFTTVFGLGSEELRRGAESLLHGQGELGQALFSASLAGTPVHRILEGLDAEARQIFSGRARANVSLRPAVSAYEEGLRQSREATVRPEAWEDALKALADAREERDGLDAELKAQRTRRDWLQRCLDALPILGRLGEQEQRRDAQPVLPDLGAAFVETAEAALAARDGAQAELSRLTLRIEQLGARVGENRPSAKVLVRAAEIESAHLQLAVYRQWRNEGVGLETDLARAEADLRVGMRQLGVGGEPEAVEALRVRSADELALAEAAAALDKAEEALTANREEADRLRRELASIEKRLAALPPEDVSSLRAGLARTAGPAEAAKGLSRKGAELMAARTSLERRHGLLTGAPTDPRAAFDLAVPAAATLRRFEAESTRLDQDRARAEEAMAESDKKRGRLGGQLQRLERRGALPTIDALREARAHRDGAWERVLAAWKGGAEEGELDGRPLADAYPLTVEAADRIGDRLREDAEAVAQAEELRLQLREAETDKARAQADLGRAQAARAEWEGRWGAAWSPCGVTPLSAAEMLEWRDRWVEFRVRYEAWEKAAEELAGARADIASAVALLGPLLPEVGDRTLPGLRAEAERRVRKADEAQGARSQLQAQAADLRADLEGLDAARTALAEAVEVAGVAWQACCAALGLPVGAGTGTGLALLEQRKHLVASLDAWTSLGRAVDGKRQAIAGYEADVHALADALGLPGGAVEVREGALWSELETARARQTRQAQAQADLEAERAGLPQVSQTLAVAEREVADCIAASSASDEAALKALLADLKARHGVEAEIGHLRETLHVAARGEPLDDFIARVRAEPADALTAEREGLDQAIQDLEGSRDRAVEHLARAEEDKARLEQSGDEAAGHLQTALNTAARIRHEAARYLRLQLAMHFLREQIERFRRENQAPLLARAGELFRTITEGSCDGLGTDFASDDTPLLVGVRDGEKVPIQGMSDGTRDQLYLALRLAAIERHQAHHEPMPVILDDLLVTFDDRRARAILPLLSELGRKTQVMLFTHHRHLIDLARGALPADGFHLHELLAREGR